MRTILIILTFLLFQSMKAQQKPDNHLLVLKKDALYVYNALTKDWVVIAILNKTEKWKMGKVSVSNDTVRLLMYADLEYLNFNIDKVLTEKEFVFLCNNKNTISDMDNRIYEKDGVLFIKNGIKTPIELKERYLYDRYVNTKKYLSEDGDLYLMQGNEKHLFIKGNINDKIKCGYFQPDLSTDEKLIICEYRCSKHNGKKQIGKSQIFEIEVKTKAISKMNLFGYNPTYSEDGAMILYNNENGYNLYFRITDNNVLLENVTQAIWIR